MSREKEIYLATRCPCWICTGTKISNELTKWILNFEKYIGQKIHITSGARCESYNREVGGHWDSAHLTDATGVGHAVDFQIRGIIPIEGAFKADNFAQEGRLGIYQNHLHKDLRIPTPSKYWYVDKDIEYSRNTNSLKEFLIQLKKEGRLGKYDSDNLNDIISSFNIVHNIPKKEYRSL